MSSVKLHDKTFGPYLSEDEIQSKIRAIARQLSTDYNGRKPLFIAVLNGSFMFAADLMKEVSIQSEITFVKLASYNGLQSSGDVKTRIGLEKSVRGRTVVIVEDIIDSGNTMIEMLDVLKKENPSRIIIATLLLKPDALQHPIEIDYVGFKVPNDFLVGYGLDYDGLGRNLKNIYVRV